MSGSCCHYRPQRVAAVSTGGLIGAVNDSPNNSFRLESVCHIQNAFHMKAAILVFTACLRLPALEGNFRKKLFPCF